MASRHKVAINAIALPGRVLKITIGEDTYTFSRFFSPACVHAHVSDGWEIYKRRKENRKIEKLSHTCSLVWLSLLEFIKRH